MDRRVDEYSNDMERRNGTDTARNALYRQVEIIEKKKIIDTHKKRRVTLFDFLLARNPF
jgi:hypothetical protein